MSIYGIHIVFCLYVYIFVNSLYIDHICFSTTNERRLFYQLVIFYVFRVSLIRFRFSISIHLTVISHRIQSSMLILTGFNIYGLLELLIFLCMGLCSGECARSISTGLYETINTTMAVNPSVVYTRNELMSMRSSGVETARLAPSVHQSIKDLEINTFSCGCRAGKQEENM